MSEQLVRAWRTYQHQQKGPYRWDTLSGAVQQYPTPTSMVTLVDVEPNMPRTATGIAHRGARLRALGNGQVPRCTAGAWCLLQATRRRA